MLSIIAVLIIWLIFNVYRFCMKLHWDDHYKRAFFLHENLFHFCDDKKFYWLLPPLAHTPSVSICSRIEPTAATEEEGATIMRNSITPNPPRKASSSIHQIHRHNTQKYGYNPVNTQKSQIWNHDAVYDFGSDIHNMQKYELDTSSHSELIRTELH